MAKKPFFQFSIIPLILSLFVFFLTFGHLKATSPEPRMQIENFISRMQLDSATILLEEVKRPGYKAFYETNILIYKYFSTQNIDYIREVRKDWDKNIEALEGLPDTDSLKFVMLSEVQCKKAVVEFLDKNYLTAVRHARLGRNHIKESQKLFPKNISQNKILGTFNVAFGGVPSKYKWITQTLGFHGDVNEGIAQLERAAESGTIFSTEALIILFFVEKNMLNLSKEPIQRLENYRKEKGASIMVDYFLASGYQSLKKNDQALEILKNRDRYIGNGVFFSSYWDYSLGKAHYFKGENEEAKKYLSRFIKNHKGDLYRTDALFRLGMALTFTNNYALGKHFFSLVTKEESSGFDEDEYAKYMSGEFARQQPDTNLLALFHARNLYDGGYFDQALGILNKLETSKNTLNEDEVTELYYRLGRVYQSLAKWDLSRSYYQKTIEASPETQTWMQAYSYYFLAEMAKSDQDYTTAREFYQKALSFDDYFYQAGLENRCKIALSDIKKK